MPHEDPSSLLEHFECFVTHFVHHMFNPTIVSTWTNVFRAKSPGLAIWITAETGLCLGAWRVYTRKQAAQVIK
ncbi:hypothetical protein FISHEDRAFT_72174 [Fistulina hepatica ATCC 64428]|uniref:Uncharacterized protein n=1 Tax=Fistulina hepatica ATCC 64428 TaxID=1128425 RepID=A0A0D7AFQ2_9AGAR|nr:hypothetical protein FISHEDRAFT_72174 [Fistulina hepatica ATCC 64428]